MPQENQAPQISTADSNVLTRAKIDNLKALQDMGVTPWPWRFDATHRAGDLHKRYADLADGTETADVVTVAGRIMSYRNSGMFIDLHDDTGKIQIFSHKQSVAPELLAQIAHYDIGDIIGVTGIVRRTPRGELTVNTQNVVMLGKSVRPLPEKYHGLADVETRYRKRYLDLIVNADSRAAFRQRSRIIATLRRLLDDDGFMEVETPILHTIPGGASAKPFTTHHNTLDMQLFLRIAPELHLKRLIVGGFERVYEIGRNFRNEGISVKHNPEFTSLEVYQAYADYNTMMGVAEKLVSGACKAVHDGKTSVTYGPHAIDLQTPWPRKTMLALVQDATGADFAQLDAAAAARQARTLGLHVEDGALWGEVVQAVFEEKVEDTLIQPVFVTDIPKDVMPLAKTHPTDPRLTESFELYINGWEVGPAFSELNDPFDQAARFEQQVAARDRGNDEAQHFDADYIEALEYGMPPTGGLGIGIDRLVMILTDSHNIRDVIAFPTMRVQKNN